MRRGRPVVLAAMAALIFSGCAEEAAAPRPQPRNWYSGGTVHNADAARWNEVEPRNRLATCADLVTNALLDKGVNPSALKVDQLKPWAQELEACITQAFEGGGSGRVQEIAPGCLAGMNLQWPPPSS